MTDHARDCRDPQCPAHGRFLRRIQRLARAVAAERDQLALTERALEVNSDEVIRLRAAADERGVMLTDEEATAVDRSMDDHMYGHQISNNINGMSCNVHCRTQALAIAFAPIAAARMNAVLAEAAKYLREQGSLRFDEHGPEDPRGAAFWDAGCAIDPADGNVLKTPTD